MTHAFPDTPHLETGMTFQNLTIETDGGVALLDRHHDSLGDHRRVESDRHLRRGPCEWTRRQAGFGVRRADVDHRDLHASELAPDRLVGLAIQREAPCQNPRQGQCHGRDHRDHEAHGVQRRLRLLEQWGVRCISIGYFVPEGQAVIWRGPMLHKALEQFLTDVFWDEPDFLLVDMPPGTGDIALSLAQYLPRGEVFVVTTPQPAAQKVASLSAAMAAKVNLPVRGVIENMSWFTGDDGKRYEIFGSGGGELLAQELDVPLLGQLPLVPELREGGDNGRPITAVDPDSEAAQLFHQIATKIAVDMKPKKVFSEKLKIL